MDNATNSSAQFRCAGCPLLELPGELRNRIYSQILEENKFRVLRKPQQAKPRDHIFKNNLWEQCLGLTQVCRMIRSEYLPLYRAKTLDNVTPQDLYEYINKFLVIPGVSEGKIVGSVLIDFSANLASSLDIKPLLHLVRRAKSLHIGTHDIIANHIPVPDIQNILADIYDITDLEAFYDYVDKAMVILEVECDEMKGVEIVFELKPEYWEDWMGEWSKPDHDPNYRIPLELGENVVQWGKGCGMELDRAAGSHLTVNFRRGK